VGIYRRSVEKVTKNLSIQKKRTRFLREVARSGFRFVFEFDSGHDKNRLLTRAGMKEAGCPARCAGRKVRILYSMKSLGTIFSGLFLSLVLVACVSSPEFERQAGSRKPLIFKYTDDHARQVDLVGAFNGWKIGATPLTTDGHGNWTVGLELPKGVYRYMFVIDGVHWITDPNAARRVPDGFGRMNSVIIAE